MTIYTWLHGSPAFGADGISRFELEDRIRSAELTWEPPDQAAAAAGLPASMSALRPAVAASMQHSVGEGGASAAEAADSDVAASGGAGALPAEAAGLGRGSSRAVCSRVSGCASSSATEQLAQAHEVVAGLLQKDSRKRWTVQQARQHPWLRSVLKLPAPAAVPPMSLRPIEFIEAAPAPVFDGAGSLPALPPMPPMPAMPPGLLMPVGMPALPPALPGGSLPPGAPALPLASGMLPMPASGALPSMQPAFGR